MLMRELIETNYCNPESLSTLNLKLLQQICHLNIYENIQGNRYCQSSLQSFSEPNLCFAHRQV